MRTVYQVFIEESIIEDMAAMTVAKQKEIRAFIHSLANNPFDGGDFLETDREGRECFCKIIDGFAISYFPDHAVKEVKVFELVRADN